MVAFLPDQPTFSARDPLQTFLLGVGASMRPASPPWIRLFRLAAPVGWVSWAHEPQPCPACETHVVFHTDGHPRPGVVAECRLCLACGWVGVEYIRPGTSLRETPAVGGNWSPPSPAVARLRQAVLRPYWREHWPIDGD